MIVNNAWAIVFMGAIAVITGQISYSVGLFTERVPTLDPPHLHSLLNVVAGFLHRGAPGHHAATRPPGTLFRRGADLHIPHNPHL